MAKKQAADSAAQAQPTESAEGQTVDASFTEVDSSKKE